MWNIYSSGHIHSATVTQALAQGTRFPLLTGARHLAPGGMITYGALRGLELLLAAARRDKRDFVYLDNGYFRPSNHAKGEYTGYYRMTLNALQHDGHGAAAPTRWRALKRDIHDWRPARAANVVLVCPPGERFAALQGFSAKDWLRDTLATLRAHTDRPIVVREKLGPGVPPLFVQLNTTHALVTYNSNAAVEALIYGVPVFCTAECAASAMGGRDLARIETPVYHEGRAQWAANLAAHQWTLDEMRSGLAWHEFINEPYEHETAT